PGDACTQVLDPGLAAERAQRAEHELALVPVAVAVGHAQPARTAAAVLARTTRAAVVLGPAHAVGRDRAAGDRLVGRTERPHVIELVVAAQLDLVPVVVEQRTVTLVHRRVVVVLHQVGVVVAGVGVDRAFHVAFALGPDVAGVERPLVVPGTVQLELDGLVGALGLAVAHDRAAAQADVAVLRAVEGHPLLAGRAPQRGGLAGVHDRPVARVPGAALDVGDAHVLDRAGDPAVRGVHAVGPGRIDRLLEAEDELVLEDLLQVPGHRGAH